jgi:YVTN family beta-propeller protein
VKTKSLVEYVGAGFAIAGAGIWIAAVPPVAHGETDATDAPSSSEVAPEGVDVASDHDVDRDDVDRDEDTASVTEDDPSDLPDPVTDEPEPSEIDSEMPDDQPAPATDDDIQSDDEAMPEQVEVVVTPDITVGEGTHEEPLLVEEPKVDSAEKQSDSDTSDDLDTGNDYAASAEDVQAVPTHRTGDRADERRTVEAVESEPTATSEVATTPAGLPLSTTTAEEPGQAPTAATLSSATSAVPNPVVTLLAGVLSFFGLNSSEAPDNPVGALLWGLFRRVETAIGVVPRATQPTVSTPTAEGVVTGTVEFDTTPGLPLTYTGTVDPAQGVVIVNPDGSFTFTPTEAARLAAGAPGAAAAASIIVTASNGLAATNAVFAVPLSPYEKGAVIATIPVGAYVSAIAVSPDGSYLYVGAMDFDPETGVVTNTVKVIDTATNTVRASIPVGDEQPMAIAFAPDGTNAYVTMPNDTVLVINAGHAVFAGISLNGSPSGVALTPDGAYAYVVNSSYPFSYVAVINTATQMKIGEIPVGYPSSGIAIANAPNGTFAYVAHSSTTGEFSVQVIDTGVNIVVKTISLETPTGSMVATPDGSYVYVLDNSAEGLVKVIDTDTNTVVKTIQMGRRLDHAVASPDSVYLYVMVPGEETQLQVIDTATNTVIGTLATFGDRYPVAGAVSDDGSLLYFTNGFDGTVSAVYTGNWVDE